MGGRLAGGEGSGTGRWAGRAGRQVGCVGGGGLGIRGRGRRAGVGGGRLGEKGGVVGSWADGGCGWVEHHVASSGGAGVVGLRVWQQQRGLFAGEEWAVP